MVSLPNARPSFASICLLEKSHQNPIPTNTRTMMMITKICPDDFDFWFSFMCLHLIAETQAFDYLAVSDQHPVTLHSGVGAEAVSSVHFKVNQIPVKRLIHSAHVCRFWIAAPVDACTARFDQLSIKPLHYNFFVVRRIRPVPLGIRRGRFCVHGSSAESQCDGANQQQARFHFSILIGRSS